MTAQRGFTLIELAIVLVIVTILIGGLAMPLSAQIQARRIAETNKTLEEAREAIMGYAMSHPVSNTCNCQYDVDGDGVSDTTDCPSTLSCPVIATPATPTTLTLPITRHFLPCPDLAQVDPEPDVDNDGNGQLGDLNNGREDRDAAGACSSRSGNLPWVTLGAAVQDAWGNRLHYRVTPAFSNSTTGFSNTNTGELQVCSVSGCAAVNVASNVPVVLVSHGPNGWGARNVNGSTLAAPTSADELENTNNDINFVSRTPTTADNASGEFDDLLVWISDGVLRSRVCPAGGCP